jgi:hypothetical protein
MQRSAYRAYCGTNTPASPSRHSRSAWALSPITSSKVVRKPASTAPMEAACSRQAGACPPPRPAQALLLYAVPVGLGSIPVRTMPSSGCRDGRRDQRPNAGALPRPGFDRHRRGDLSTPSGSRWDDRAGGRGAVLSGRQLASIFLSEASPPPHFLHGPAPSFVAQLRRFLAARRRREPCRPLRANRAGC